MAKIIVISSYAPSLVNFRGEMIKSFVRLGHQVFALGPEAGYTGELQKLGAYYIQIPLGRTGLNPIKDLQSVFALWRIMRDIRPDIVLAYTIKPVIYGSLVAGWARVPRVYSMITGLGFAFMSGSGQKTFLQRAVRALYRQALKCNQAVFFQNPDDLSLFRDQGLLKQKTKPVLIHGSGVELERYAFTPPTTEPFSFLLIARLIWDKGIGEYVEAARILKARYPDVSFKLLGSFDSNPAAISSSSVEAWVAEGVIMYLGKTADVRPYIAEASVYVLPSFYREGTPRSVLEAMAMGRPVITTDAPGCRETVVHGVNGYLVPVRDAQTLAEAMERFIQNPEMVGKMGRESRRIAEEKYDVHKVNAVILEAMGLVVKE